MKILLLGGAGMLGHKLWQFVSNEFETYVTLRQSLARYAQYDLFPSTHTIEHLSAENLESLHQLIGRIQPQVVINCIGIVKQRHEAKAAIPSIAVNALLPHQLADLCESHHARLIHFSTDCVFSGNRGHYTEDDLPDPVDLYGQTKVLGEVDRPGSLTLRTSIIGWEIDHYASLIEWFARQRDQTIKGYRGAIYSGLTTTALARVVLNLIKNYPNLSGIYQVASQPISKYDLLCQLRDELGWQDVTITPDDDFQCDRSLVSKRFETAANWMPPTWHEMITGLASEWPIYENYRRPDPT